MNFWLARDQVVLLETAGNLWASRRKANDFCAVFFSSVEMGGITKHLLTGPAGNSTLVLWPQCSLGFAYFSILVEFNLFLLRPWQTRTHCCGHIVADTLLPRKMFPRLPVRATIVADTNFVSGRQKCVWFCSETFCVRNKCFPVCAAQENRGQQCFHNNVSSFTRALTRIPHKELVFELRVTSIQLIAKKLYVGLYTSYWILEKQNACCWSHLFTWYHLENRNCLASPAIRLFVIIDEALFPNTGLACDGGVFSHSWEFKKNTTATGTSLNKRFNEQNRWLSFWPSRARARSYLYYKLW